jgi:predicted DNA-binding transcriptional regulator YafY
MRTSTDTTGRYIAILGLLPQAPRKTTAKIIHDELRSRAHVVTKRTIERDLERLSGTFPITCDTEGRTNHWYWTDRNALMQIPAMSQSTALALCLAEGNLTSIMPPATLKLLEPYFRHAREVLGDTALGKWMSKVRITRRGPVLTTPVIDPAIQEAVYQALFENRQLQVHYKAKSSERPKEQVLNPLGIVSRDGVIYLVATAWKYTVPYQYALHRMSRAKLADKPALRPESFDFAKYVDIEFAYPVSDKKIRLKALFSKDAAFHLSERRLSEDQSMEDTDDGRVLVTATVLDSDELRWWLRGFGDQVEILSPRGLRADFSDHSAALAKVYGVT